MKKSAVLVLVTAQNCSIRNIKAGRVIAERENAPLHVLSVLDPDFPPENLAGNIEKLYTIAKSCGADITIYYDRNPVSAIARYISEQGISWIVGGYSGEGAGNGFLARLHEVVPEVSLTTVCDEKCYTISAPRSIGNSAAFCGKAGAHA